MCPSGHRYLVVCTDSESVCKVKPLPNENRETEGTIHRVLKCELIPYNGDAYIADGESRLLASVDRLLSSGTFYFTEVDDSIGRNALLHRCEVRSTASTDNLLHSSESIFLWNQRLMQTMCMDTEDQHSFRHFISPLMQGFAQSRSFAEDGIRHTVSVISRKSKRQAGTRYNARGIDDEGNVAIFTETECIVTSSVGADGADLYSFTQIRGSVPVFWSQPSSVSVEINRNFEMTKSAFQRHLDFLKSSYQLGSNTGDLVFVNLLSPSKQSEGLLSSALNNHIRSVSDSENLVLVEFDFHKFVNSSRSLEESLTPLMDTLRPYIFNFGYFSHNTQQQGILRTNCLDCLDRTNAVQMQLAWESVLMAKIASFPKASPQFKEIFTDVWVRNGDAISKGYSGTGSVLSRLVKTAGKGGGNSIATMIEHSWRSANRFIAANWDDQDRQAAFSHLLGQTSVHQLASSATLAQDLTVWIGTFNLHGRRVDEHHKVFQDFLIDPADIIIACFQETIDLTAGSVLFASRGDDQRNRIIDLQLLSVLEQLSETPESYVQVANESLVGLYISVFAKSKLGTSIDSVKSRRFKAGFGGAAGNKGSVSVSFRLFHCVEIEVVNLHLDSGVDRNDERMQQLAFVLENASTHKRSLLTAPTSHHHRNRSKAVFLCGDFNFRCDGISSQVAVELVTKGRVEKLRSFDPFVSTNAVQGNVLKSAGFREMPLTFKPTYKYEIGTGMLTDRRTPSWCDRIFFRENFAENLILDPMVYTAVETSRLSDHKPVVALFALRRQEISEMQEMKRTDDSMESYVSSVTAPTPPSPDPVDLLSGEPLTSGTSGSSVVMVPAQLVEETEETKADEKIVDLLL